jgi:hypothetical protein
LYAHMNKIKWNKKKEMHISTIKRPVWEGQHYRMLPPSPSGPWHNPSSTSPSGMERNLFKGTPTAAGNPGVKMEMLLSKPSSSSQLQAPTPVL